MSAENIKNTINHFCHFNIVDTVIIILISVILYSVARRILIKGYKGKIDKKVSKKNKTYIKVVSSIIKYIFIGLTTLIILQANGINVSSILAGVGIAGVVIGLAVQDALKDIIRGLAILSDDYFSVGDLVTYNGSTGKIIELGLNSTKIEDLTGNVITVANRKIDEISVLSGRVVINVPLSYELKVKEYKKIMDEIVKEINKNNDKLDARYLGVNNFNDSSIDHLIVFDSTPDERYQDRRDALNIILEVLEKNNIEIPYNQLDIHNK